MNTERQGPVVRRHTPTSRQATIWGGSHTLAFLYLRRLAPLVIFHAVQDTLPALDATEHQTLAIAVVAAYLMLLLSHLYRAVADRLRRASAVLHRDAAAVAFFARRHPAPVNRPA